MYHGHRSILHSPPKDDGRQPRDMQSEQSANPTYRAPSPQRPNYQYSPGRPQQSPQLANLPPLSSSLYHQRDPPPPPPPKSNYYDPTQDSGDRSVTQGQGSARFDPYPVEHQRERRSSYTYPDHRPPPQSSTHLTSPITTNLPHPSPHSTHTPAAVHHPSQSPISPRVPLHQDRYYQSPRQVAHERNPSREMPARADPMSLSSIMSGNVDDPVPSYPTKSINDSRRSSRASASINSMKVEAIAPPSPVAPPPAVKPASKAVTRDSPVQNGSSHVEEKYKPAAAPVESQLESQHKISEKDILSALAKIEAMDDASAELQDYGRWQSEYKTKGQKRLRELDAQEEVKRKRRRKHTMQKMIALLEGDVQSSRQNYFLKHESTAWQEVQDSEIAEEKERKKDMQRERRRQKTLATETQKAKEAFEKANKADDDGEKLHWKKEALKHEKKSRATEVLLQGGTPSKDLRDSTPGGPNLEGGVMSTLNMSAEPVAKEAKRGRGGGRWANRPKKTKEQKAHEKELAAAGQAAIDRGEELPAIAPKEAVRLEALAPKETPKPVVESIHRGTLTTKDDYEAYTSKAYIQIYESIWRDIGKNGVNKVYRVKNDSITTKQSNLRKTAQLASKEARRWQLRTNKGTKDVQARAKRSMKEMLSFWKRNERDERDQRKVAERQELDNAKKAEADREAERQRRKLNFLISQTELYSHFIGKKVKTDDIERSTDDAEVAATTQKLDPGQPHQYTIDLPGSVAKLGPKVTNFEDLDFDGDEKDLQEAARANAQHAVMEAKRRAQEFDENAADNDPDEDGEMNFQNPTSLGNMEIPQPKLLSCQLKEYQLKGLNWLVNLYEQGINGILADEMGLGKTVQSISVMAYLAEVHNIWGPFLVIAPASTLHNWQQEIAKFVPEMKVLPYWGTAKDRKILRKFWDRKHITYRKDAPFHIMVTSYQMVVVDQQYFQKMKWQYMILDEAQAIKSSSSSRWKALLNYHCRNRLLLTGTPIQNNMQELWALLHFIMPSLFDSHDEFSEWFSKDIESHAASNTKLNEDQLRRLHMILKPFMLRRIKKHVQKELGDKIELDIFCDMTYRQRAYYSNLRAKISIMDLIEKAALGDDQDSATLMNLVMQFRKVCNHPDLFERADTKSPFSFSTWAETASFLREGSFVQVAYSVKNAIEFELPRLVYNTARLDRPGSNNYKIGWRNKYLNEVFNVFAPENIRRNSKNSDAFSWLRFADMSAQEVAVARREDVFARAIHLKASKRDLSRFSVMYDGADENTYIPGHAMLNIVDRDARRPLADISQDGHLHSLMNIAKTYESEKRFHTMEQCAAPKASAPPVSFYCASQAAILETQRTFFNVPMRSALNPVSEITEESFIKARLDPADYPVHSMYPAPEKHKSRFTNIQVPSMRRFVTDSGKLAKLDSLLRELKEGGHRVLLYFQMTRMIDLMEEYLTYRNYKYCRLDGSTKLEDRRDTVADFQTQPEIFVFLLSTRAGGLGINLTSADTVIFYDSDWNPTIDSQAMDRAHRLGQTKQVTVYRMITRGTIEERIRKRALQKEEVQRVVITGHAGNSGGIDFNARSRENRTKDIALWLADDEQAAAIEQKEKEMEEQEKANPDGGKRKKKPAGKKGKDISMDDLYHEGEGQFDDRDKASGAATPLDLDAIETGPGKSAPAGGKGKRGKGMSKKAKTLKQRLAVADGDADPSTFQ